MVPGAAVKWRYLGIQLLDPTSGTMLDIIEKDHPNDTKGCCARMLQRWLDKTPHASWNHVLKALRSPSVELNYLANQIGQKVKEKCETKFREMFVYHNYDIVLLIFYMPSKLPYKFVSDTTASES